MPGAGCIVQTSPMKNNWFVSLALVTLAPFVHAGSAVCPEITGVYACTDNLNQTYVTELQLESNNEGETKLTQFRYGIRPTSESTMMTTSVQDTVNHLLFAGVTIDNKAQDLANLFGMGDHVGYSIGACLNDVLSFNVVLAGKTEQVRISRNADGLDMVYRSVDQATGEARDMSAACKPKAEAPVSPVMPSGGVKADSEANLDLPSTVQMEIPAVTKNGDALNVIFKTQDGRNYRTASFCYDSAFWGESDAWDFGNDNVSILTRTNFFYSLCVDLRKMKVFSGSKSGAALSDSVVGSVINKNGRYQIQLHIENELSTDGGTLFVDEAR